MDKATVKLLLQSYRPHDANDPIFAEALREVAADPDLAAWFEEMQRFDAVMASKFQEMPVPADVKNHILLGYHSAAAAPAARRSRALGWLGAIAAVFVLALVCWRLLAPPERPMNALALQAISYTEQMPPLQFVCFDAAAVAAWVNEQPGTRNLGFKLPKPDKSLSMAMIGSSVVDWNGRPVVMICLQNGKRMAMLYILNPSDAAGLNDGATETVQKAGWVVQAKNTKGRVQILTTKGRAEDMNFTMPF